MLIFKVMVCFLAVFTGEDYVGGLPTIQDSPDNHRPGESVRSASNQGVANEPGSQLRPTKLLDYAEGHEEEVRRRVNPELKILRTNPSGVLAGKISAVKFEEESSPARAEGDRLLKSGTGSGREDEKIRGGVFRTDQFADKSESRNDQATSGSLGEKVARRFSSAYAKVDLDEKVSRQKQEFKNDLSAYLAEVLDAVVRTKTSADNPEADKPPRSSNALMNSGGHDPAGLLTGKTNVPVPGEETRTSANGTDDFPVENRQRKSVGDVVTWHQQSTNMRPTRTQHLVQNKRSPSEGNVLKLPGYGGRRFAVKNPTDGAARGANRRQFNTDGSPPSSLGNQLRFTGLNPIQINAAMAYSNRQPPAQAFNIDLSRALRQFGPAQLHALRGVFDKVPPPTQNFKPIAPEQVAYVPPKIIYETKIVPTPFMPFRAEQKTVEALSALLGKNPAQQLQGFNLILRKDRPDNFKGKSLPAGSSLKEISRQDIHDGVALSQAFVTPVPSVDINAGLADGAFRFSHDGRDPNEETGADIGRPFDHRTPQYLIPENINPRENPFKTIPIIEEPEEERRGQTVVGKELPPVQVGVEILETTRGGDEGRYFHHKEEGTDHGDAYAAKYSFGYHVKDYNSGNDFGHQETRDGVVTNGRYHVLLPDGRLQNVKYHVDEGGYHAKVSYQSA